MIVVSLVVGTVASLIKSAHDERQAALESAEEPAQAEESAPSDASK